MAGPSHQHRVLVVGAGSIGERLIRCFRSRGRCGVSFVEINEDLRRAIAARYGVSAFATLSEGIASGPSVAVIATPAHLHIEMATSLAQAGIHLLIEKPLSTSEAGIAELTKLVGQKRLIAGIAYVYRSHPVLSD